MQQLSEFDMDAILYCHISSNCYARCPVSLIQLCMCCHNLSGLTCLMPAQSVLQALRCSGVNMSFPSLAALVSEIVICIAIAQTGAPQITTTGRYQEADQVCCQIPSRGSAQLLHIASMVLLHVKVRISKLASRVRLSFDARTLIHAEN